MSRKRHFLKVLVANMALFVAVALQAAPDHLNFQGRLTDVNGQPVAENTPVRFEVYDVLTGGSKIWPQGRDAEYTVSPNEKGLFEKEFGPFDADFFSADKDYFIQVYVLQGGWEELRPRKKLTSVPFASYAVYSGTAGVAARALHADTADSISAIPFSSVGSNELVDGDVQTVDLASGAVTNGKIDDLAVTAEKIGPNAVTGEKIAGLSISSAHITAGAVEEQHLASYSVTEVKIGTAAVTNVKIAPGAVDGAKIAVSAVDSDQLAGGSVDPGHFSPASLAMLRPKSIQRFETSVTVTVREQGGAATVNQTINAVDLSKSYVLIRGAETPTWIGNFIDQFTGITYKAELTSPTNVEVFVYVHAWGHQNSGYPSMTVKIHYTVIESH